MAWRRAIVVFRRDLRVHDQLALARAFQGLCAPAAAAAATKRGSYSETVTQASGTLHPIFVFDPRQCDPQRNPYFNANSMRFLVESLTSLESDLAEDANSSSAALSPLTVFFGEAHKVIEMLVDPSSSSFIPDIDALVVNEDVTPFSRARDTAISDVCQRHGVEFVSVRGDGLLCLPETVRTKTSNTVYKVFTPFYRACLEKRVSAPALSWPPSTVVGTVAGANNSRVIAPRIERLPLTNDMFKGPPGFALLERAVQVYEQVSPAAQQSAPAYSEMGGRGSGLALLQKSKTLKEYAKLRDDVTKAENDPQQGTSRLGPHLKFGTVGIREAYAAVRSIEPLVRQLYWREFYSHLAYNFPDLLRGQLHADTAPVDSIEAAGKAGKVSPVPATANANMQTQFDKIWWNTDDSTFQLWCEGKTGYPIVDAGIRQLLATGQMHNRARMISACFLTKDLHIDWRRGERFFAQHLTDYDPANNNGGWQWAASTGADAQPYFRIFHPTRQLEKFDKEGKYVKRWIPELAAVPLVDILNWEKGHKTSSGKASGYPPPMVDHSVESKKAIALFKETAEAAKGAQPGSASKGAQPGSAAKAAVPKIQGTEGRQQTINGSIGAARAASSVRSMKDEKSPPAKRARNL